LAKPLVFVHGFACTHADWRPLLAHFGAGHPVFTPDLRGHGATHARPEDCSIETYGADIAALLEGKDLKGAVLIGHSMGCRVVLQAYLSAPDRVAALALIDGAYRGGGGDPAAAEQAGRAAIAAGGYLDFQRRLFDGMFLAPSALSRAIVERATRLPESVGAVLHPRVARWDTAHMDAALAAVQVPLLVIQTTRMAGGKRVPLRAGDSSPWLDLVRRHVPQARIEIIPGAGHFPQLEVPEAVGRLLSELIGA
jgi:pimeloyl-ACP methyl ester carboxylesterase